jgi:hypothetical protein
VQGKNASPQSDRMQGLEIDGRARGCGQIGRF